MIQNQNFSYNGILNTLEAFASAHPEIYRFIAEDEDQMSEMTSKDEAFPIMFVAPIDNTYDFQMNEYRLRIYAYDRLMKDRSNVNDCRSRADKILNDLDVWLKEYDQLPFEVDSVSFAYPFSSELMTDVTGWYIEVTIQSPSYSVCDIPFLTPVIITGYTCDIQYTNEFLTCSNLGECETFTDAIDNLQEQIDELSPDNFYTTGATLSGSTLIFDRNDEVNAYDVDLSSLEFSGDYNDLTNTPTNLSDFNNNEGFVSCDDLSDCPVIQQGFQLITNAQQDIIDLQNELPNYLPLSGGTMTGEIITAIERWTFDFMDKLDITIYADDNFIIDEIDNIVDTPTITIEVNDVSYTLGDAIALGDKIKITSDIASVVKMKIIK